MNNKLLEMMKKFINGRMDPQDFSYEFPDLMLECEDDQALEILDDMPEYCSFYEPDEAEYRKETEFLNDQDFKLKVKEVYKKFEAYVNEN